MLVVTNYNNLKINENYRISNCTAFEKGAKVFLYHNTSGHSIILEKDIWDNVLNGIVDDGVVFLLNQRGFFDQTVNNDSTIENTQPKFFLINMTDCCNLRCKYCFRDVHQKTVPNISNDQVRDICLKIIDYCHQHNVDNISIQPWGGEPLLAYEQIIKIDDIMKQYNINYRIIFATNATLITKEIAKEMKKRNFYIGISIDGNEKLQNIQRPFKNEIKNSYRSVKQGVEKLYLKLMWIILMKL